MKNLFIALALSLSCTYVSAQKDEHAYQDVNINHTRTEMSIKVGEEHLDQKTIVNGHYILGIPYLSGDWAKGSIILKNGRTYTAYKLKFDILNQHVLFLSGNDSLEVTDEIKEFTLIPNAEKKQRFINSSELKKGENPVFYEILIDNPKGYVLKSYKKEISSDSRGLTDPSGTKYLKTVFSYFYYDKSGLTLYPFDQSQPAIKKILNLSERQADALMLSVYDFSEEKDLLEFFNSYFSS